MRLILLGLILIVQTNAATVGAAGAAQFQAGLSEGDARPPSATASNDEAQEVPEASTWMMLTAGMLLMGMSVLRNRRGKTSAKNSGIAAPRTMR